MLVQILKVIKVGFARNLRWVFKNCDKVWIFTVVECLYVFMKILMLTKVGLEGNFRWMFKKCNKVWIFTTKRDFEDEIFMGFFLRNMKNL